MITFAFYMVVFSATCTVIAAVEQWWTARVERAARRHARAEARAKRMIGERSSVGHGS